MPRKATPKPVELDRSRTPFVVAGFVVVGLMLTGGTIMWAQSDAGQIDVSATILNSQSENMGGVVEDNTPNTPPAPEYASMPNGGLQSQSGDTPRPPEPEPTPTDSASSTATTTDEGTSGETAGEGALDTRSEGGSADASTQPNTDTSEEGQSEDGAVQE